MHKDTEKCYWSLTKTSLVEDLPEGHLAGVGKSIKEGSTSGMVTR